MILTGRMGNALRKLGAADLPRLSRVASIVPNSLDDERRTVDLIWTTGARVLRGYYDRYWEELSLDPKHVRMKRLNNGAPFLNTHNGYDAAGVIGVVESASLDGKRGIAKVRFARAEDDEEADKIYRKVRDGILQNISVGYSTYRMELMETGADKVPLYMATDWEPYELSVVPSGADDGAGFRAAKSERTTCVFFTRQQETTMPPENGDDDDTQTETPPASAPAVAMAATRAAEQARHEESQRESEASKAAADKAIVAERSRIAEIRKLGEKSRLGATWAQTLIEAGTSLGDARAAALDHLTSDDAKSPPTDGHLRISGADDARDKWIRGATAWLLERSGARDMLERAKAKMPRERAFQGLEFESGYGDFVGLTPAELARDSLHRCGVSTRGMDRMRMVGHAFTHTRGNFQTTSDFATLLEVSLGKILLGAYATQQNTWQVITKSDQVPDFRTSNRYRTGSIEGLDVILEHGEYKNGKIPDGSKYGIGTQRTGKIFGLSREAIVNDDMGALTDLATKFGQSSMRTIESAVYALILANSGLGPTQTDAQPFFHTNRANVNATGSALSTAGIDADRVVFRAQKDPSGLDFLDLVPAVLLVPDSLYGQAGVINDSQYDTDKVANGRMQEPNRVRGLFRQVVGTPRLTGTRRYLIAPQMDWIVVAFLEGYPGPVLESQMGWRVDGVEWKVTLYAKPQMGDPKAAVTNAGV